VYDPAARISAKQAATHPYFDEGTWAHSGRPRVPGYGASRNGYY